MTAGRSRFWWRWCARWRRLFRRWFFSSDSSGLRGTMTNKAGTTKSPAPLSSGCRVQCPWCVYERQPARRFWGRIAILIGGISFSSIELLLSSYLKIAWRFSVGLLTRGHQNLIRDELLQNHSFDFDWRRDASFFTAKPSA